MHRPEIRDIPLTADSAGAAGTPEPHADSIQGDAADTQLDRLTRLAARVLVAPVAVVSLIEGKEQPLAQAARDQEIGRPEAELLSSISHDLQQPLTVIKSQAQLLRRSIRDGLALPADDVMASLAHIVAAADRMMGQLKELLNLSTPRLGRPVGAVRRPADLVDIARQAVGDHQRGAEATALALATTVATLVALVDAERLRRVLDNVLGDATKYSPGGGAVLVSLEREREPAAPTPCSGSATRA